MHRTLCCGSQSRYSRSSFLVIVFSFALFVPAGGGIAGERPAPAADATKDVRVLLFNLNPSMSYSILKNSVLFASSNSSQMGVVGYADEASVGDRYETVESSGNPSAPSAPSGLTAQGDDVGCAQLSWNDNQESDIHSYRLYYGTSSVEGGGAQVYDDSVNAGDATSTKVCGLSDGTYYFAVRALNTAGLLSPLSAEVSASVSNGNAQPPLPPQLVTATAGPPGCIEVVWVPNGSPDIVGYVIDFGTVSVENGGASEYEDSVDVGGVASFELNGLADDMYYVAVRSKNYLGVLSAYSAEESVQVIAPAVLISSFTAETNTHGVNLAWDVTSDETLLGFRVCRSKEGSSITKILNGGALVPPERSSYFDGDVEAATTYIYHIFAVETNGDEYRSPAVRATTRVLFLTLMQNVPNPFNPVTAISFTLPAAARARLTVYDVRGALVKELIDRVMPAGIQTVYWDGTNERGENVGTGQYFYRLTVRGKSLSKKMLLLK